MRSNEGDAVGMRLEPSEHVEQDAGLDVLDAKRLLAPSRATGLASRTDRCRAPSTFVLAHPGQEGLALGGHAAVASETVQRYLCR